MARVPVPKARPIMEGPSIAPVGAIGGNIPVPKARPPMPTGLNAPGTTPPLPMARPGARPALDIDGIIERTDGGPEDQNTFLAAAKAIAAYKETGDPLSAAAMGFIQAKAAKEEMRQAAEDKAYERSEKADERDYQRSQDERTWSYREGRDAKEDDQWSKAFGLQRRQDEREETNAERSRRSQDYQDLKIAQEIELIAARAEQIGVDPETSRDITQALENEVKSIRDAVESGSMDPDVAAERTRRAFEKADAAMGIRPDGEPGEPELDGLDLRTETEPEQLSGNNSAITAPGWGGGVMPNAGFLLPPTDQPSPWGRVNPNGAPPAQPGPAAAAPALSGEGTQENPLRGLPDDEAAAAQFVQQLPAGTVYEWQGYLIRKK